MSAEAKNSHTDMFDIFWNAVLLDSSEFDLSLLDEKHVPSEENREINFDKLENRLGYMYRFGNFNIHLSEKCITKFLENYSEAYLLFSKNNLKICSFTSGPGFDLIGLFQSIFKSSIRLKSVPDVKIVSLYNTWWNISQRLFTDFYEVIRSCFEKNIDGPLSVEGLVNDMHSKLSFETKTCIEDSDILLMFKVFYSAKATLEKAVDSMKEIFSLLKPGSFVFFLGSKTNTKELADNVELQSFVDCIIGPIKISSDLQDEDIIKPAPLQPRKSGSGYFIVWKKKEVTSQEQKPKKKKTRKKNKLKNNGIVTENDETNDSIDTQSEMSFNSCGKQSETFTYGSRSASCENLSTTGIKTKSKRKGLRKEVLKHLFSDSLHNLSDNSEIDSKPPTFHKDIAFDNKNFDELQTVSRANLFRSHSFMETSKKNLVARHLNSSLSDLPHSVNSITSLFDKMQIQPGKAKSRSACSLNENHQRKKEGKHVAEKEDFNPAKFQDDLLRNIEIGQKLKIENVSSEIIQDESNKNTKKSSKKKSVMNENSSMLSESVIENKIDKNMHNARAALENKIQGNLTHSEECYSVEEKTLGKSHESKQDFNTLLQLKLKVQNPHSSEISQGNSKKSKPCKKNRSQSMINEKSMLSGLVAENEIHENILTSRITVENNNQSNLIQSKSCKCIEEKASNISDESKQDFNSLLQRCESLVTSLEKLAHSVEKNITMKNNQHFRCSFHGSCAEFKPLPVCATSCSVHFNCCRKRNCNCHLCLKSICASCARINSCEANRAEACDCSREIGPKRFSNISAPYIEIPVTKEDILHILTSKKS